MTNPYTAPQSAPGAALPGRRRPSKLAMAGARLQLLPTMGNLLAVVGTARAIDTFTSAMMWDLAKLMAEVAGVWVWMVLGVVGGMAGCVLLGVAVFVQRHQPRWVKVALGLSVLLALQGAFVLVMMILGLFGGGL